MSAPLCFPEAERLQSAIFGFLYGGSDCTDKDLAETINLLEIVKRIDSFTTAPPVPENHPELNLNPPPTPCSNS